MKKYIGCIAITMLTVGLLTGCGSGIELTDEENNMVAEYMAATLLRYDLQYEKELIYTADIEEEEEFIPVEQIGEEEPTDDTQTSEEISADTEGEMTEVSASHTIADIFNTKKYEVTYVGMKEYASYSEEGNDYFIVEAPAGSKLAVFQFEISNISSEEVSLDLASEGIAYALSIEGTSVEKPLLTALTGDLQYYSETIPAGESKTAVIVFAVNEDTDISKGVLGISKGDMIAAVSAK